jgi:hypothetical protein
MICDVASHVDHSFVLMIQGTGTTVCHILHQELANIANCDIYQAIYPWPMTYAPTNEAIGHDNHAEKNLIKEKNMVMIWVVMQDVRIVLLSKKAQNFV